MKKKLPFILVICIVALFVIACVIGTLLFGWTEFELELRNSLALPIPIIGITMGSLLLVLLLLFSKTSLGKKLFNESLNALNKGIQATKECKQILQDTKKAAEKLVEEKEEELKAVKQTTTVLVDGVRREVRNKEQFYLEVFKEINNVNVQEKVNEYIKEETSQQFEDASKIIKNAKDETRKEYDNQLEEINRQIELLKKAVYENKEEVHVQFENGKKEIGEIVEDVKEEI